MAERCCVFCRGVKLVRERNALTGEVVYWCQECGGLNYVWWVERDGEIDEDFQRKRNPMSMGLSKEEPPWYDDCEKDSEAER